MTTTTETGSLGASGPQDAAALLGTMSAAQLDEAIEVHNLLREKAVRYLKDNPECLGNSAWLRAAINENDVTLSLSADGTVLSGWGSAYTSQTLDHEPFDFAIPVEALRS